MREGLVQLNHVRLAFLEVVVDVFVKASSAASHQHQGGRERKREKGAPRNDDHIPEFELDEGSLERGETECKGFGAVREGFEEANL